MAKANITVLLVDDHDLVRAGITHMLADVPGIKVIGEAGSGEDAIKRSRELSPDVILMDIRMPGIGGLEATRKILRFNPDARILIITAHNDNVYPSRMLQIGATGYITKESGIDEVVQAIRSIFSGQRYISPEIAQQLVLNKTGNDDKTPFNELSSRELQVTLMIAKGYRVNDISEKLNLSPKTINSYRYRIFEKIGIKGDVELTHLAIQYDLIED